MTEEITSTVGTGRGLRRIRLGMESGEIFADDEDFDGLTLTIEVASQREGLALLSRLRERADDPPLVHALASLGVAERAALEDALLECRAILLLQAEDRTRHPTARQIAADAARLLGVLLDRAARERSARDAQA